MSKVHHSAFSQSISLFLLSPYLHRLKHVPLLTWVSSFLQVAPSFWVLRLLTPLIRSPTCDSHCLGHCWTLFFTLAPLLLWESYTSSSILSSLFLTFLEDFDSWIKDSWPNSYSNPEYLIVNLAKVLCCSLPRTSCYLSCILMSPEYCAFPEISRFFG